jgi:hypothetical protein
MLSGDSEVVKHRLLNTRYPRYWFYFECASIMFYTRTISWHLEESNT